MLLTVANVIVAQAHEPVRRVLFIGNSITYVNDLPSAFASLATRGTPVEVDMIASAGASLADVANRPLVERALAEGGYTDVVLQERGGEAFCPATCQKDPSAILPAMQAAREVSRQARASGARVFYLGTWQSSQETNGALEFGEQAINIDRLAAGMRLAVGCYGIGALLRVAERAAPRGLECDLDAVTIEIPEIDRLGNQMVGR